MLRDTQNIWLSISHRERRLYALADVVKRTARRKKQKGLKRYIYSIYLFVSPLFCAFGESGKHDGFKIRSYWLLVRVQ